MYVLICIYIYIYIYTQTYVFIIMHLISKLVRSCTVMTFVSCSIGWCFVMYALIQIQSPDEKNGWQQSHHMIDPAFRLEACRLCAEQQAMRAERRTARSPVAIHPAAVRCDMLSHQALRARHVRKTGIGGEVWHGVTLGVSRETCLNSYVTPRLHRE